MSNDIDWPGIRAAAVALRNVRAAARQAAANLPEPERTTLIERINKRALREGWLDKAAAVQAVHSAETALSMPVQNGHQVVSNVMETRRKKSQLALAKYVREAARTAAASKGDLKIAQDVKHVAGIYATVWPQESQAGPIAIINVALIGRSLEEMPACGTVVEQA
jgi:hypothetical protein